jgi:hypothetical protein
LKAFRAMIFSAADHFKSCIGVPEGARLGKLVIFRSSKAAFYLRPLSAEKRDFSNERPTCIQFVQVTETRLICRHYGDHFSAIRNLLSIGKLSTEVILPPEGTQHGDKKALQGA